MTIPRDGLGARYHTIVHVDLAVVHLVRLIELSRTQMQRARIYGKQMHGQNVKGKLSSICENAVLQYAKTTQVVMLLILIIKRGAKGRHDHAAPG